MPKSPTRKAYARDFRKEWLRIARRITVQREKEIGLWISLVISVAFGIGQWLLGDRVNVLLILGAAIVTFAGVFGVLYSLAIFQAPVIMGWAVDKSVDEDRELDAHLSAPTDSQGIPLSTDTRLDASWPTRNQRDRVISARNMLGWTPKVVRIIEPVDAIVRVEDLPTVVKLPWRGQLVIKQFIEGGFVLDEKRTSGRTVTVEMYRGET